MELDITQFFNNAAPMDYSASVAEIGRNAGADTWNAALEDSGDYPILDNEEKREAFRKFVKSSGGWSEEEIMAWSDKELNALCIQWISGDMREAGFSADGTDEDWENYQKESEQGIVSGRLFRSEDKIYFDINE